MTTHDTTPAHDQHSSPSPRDVAHDWVTSVRARDVDALPEFYEVGAALHTAETIVLGDEQIATTLLAMAIPPDVEATIDMGQHGMVAIVWPDDADEQAVSTRMRVRRGKIVEQWIDERHTSTGRLAAVPMDMSTSGDVSAIEHDLVWDMVDKLVSLRDEPPSHVDVRLSDHPEKRGPDPVELRVTVDLPGGAVRASARSGDVPSATVIVQRRLTQALQRRAEQRFGSHHQQLSPDEGTATRPRPEREIVRRKTVSPAPSTLEEAIFDLESMGYGFFLYVDLESDRDAVVARNADGSFSEHIDPPVASLASARETLEVGSDPFVFFRDDVSHRCHVLYRRFDGNYGLIVPADD